ncbi:MAG: GIY-YIG nuclease family protein [Thermoprotei archaeon]
MHRLINNIPDIPGVYLLIIRVEKLVKIRVRSGRVFVLEPGMYVYIGSARGFGGIRGRVKRYLVGVGNRFWHIDYLITQPGVKLAGIYYMAINKTTIDYESLIASVFREKLYGVKGFGCSDKSHDYSHLYMCGDTLNNCIEKLSRLLPRGFKLLLLKPNCL